MVGFNFLSIITTFSSFLDEKTFTKLNLYVDYLCLWVAASLSTNHLSVPPTVRRHFDCPSIHCHRFISQLRVYLSIPQSIHSCFSQHPSSFQPSAARLSPDRPSVCLSVCLPVLSCFSANCQSPFRPQAVCLFTGCLSPCQGHQSMNYKVIRSH